MSEQRVMTEFGPGVIVASETVRGTTSYKIEGQGFSVWRTAQQIPEFGQLEWQQTEDHRWDNSTTLPYNPQPQFYPHDGVSTIQPNQAIDPDRRLSPADSVSFEDRSQASELGSELFSAHELDEIQARLGPKFAHIPRRVDHSSLQARLDNDPYLVFSEIKSDNAAKRRGHNPRVARQMHLEAADPELRTAAWADVRKKAIRLRKSGNIQLEAANPQAIVATVTGDHGIYNVAVIKGNVANGSSAVTDWTCSCPWGEHAFDRMTFVGRLCSHAYAALLELQSLTKRKEKPYGWSDKISSREDFDDAEYTFEAARYPDPDGRLQTDPGTLSPDLHHIPKVRRRTRVDVTANLTEAEREILEKAGFLSEPFEGTGPVEKRDWETSADYVDRMDADGSHYHEDVYGPGTNPAQQNDDDVLLASAHDPLGDSDAVVDVEDETGPEEDIVAKFQREAGAYLMGSGGGGHDDIAAVAEQFLSKTAGRQFTLAEQQALIDEDPDGGPLDQSELDLRNTHYMP